MAYIGRLEHGNQYINLAETGVYKIPRSFVPPTVEFAVHTASGTSANTKRGASAIDRYALNRQWDVPLHVYGSTPDMIRNNVDKINRMLAVAGDEFSPVYLSFHHDSDLDFEPCWGQGWRRVEVVSGRVVHGDYNIMMMGVAEPNCSIQLQVKPYPIGKPQLALDAFGAIFDNTVGAVDDVPLGIVCKEASTNLVQNPVFGNSAWNHDWTNSAHLTDLKNTDPEFVLWGTASAYLYADGTDGTYTRSYVIPGGSGGTYTISAYVKKQDSSAVTVADCAIIGAGSAQSSTYVSLGNGWYLVYYKDASVAEGAYTYGLHVESNHAVYLAGMQFHKLGYPTHMFTGSDLGCEWASTAHDSTSYAYESYLLTTGNSASGLIQTPQAWSAEFVVSPLIAMAGYANNSYLLHEETSGLYLLIEPSSDIMASDGTNVCDADGVAAITAGQIVTIHLTCGPVGGIKIYVDGALAKTQATYAPPLAMGDLWIGSDKDTNNQANMTFYGIQFYNRELTAAQVAARYANILPMITARKRVAAVPWCWTRDGDGVIDTVTDGDEAAFAIVGGVPGDDTAETFIKLAPGGTSGLTVATWLSDIFMLSGTGLNQAGETQAVNTSAVTFPSSTTMTIDRYPNEYRGRPTWIICSAVDVGDNLWNRIRISTSTTNHDGAIAATVSSTPSSTLFVTQSHTIPTDVAMPWARRTDYSDDIDYSMRLYRSVDGSANVTTGRAQVVFDNLFSEDTDGYYLLHRGYLYVYLAEPPAPLVDKRPVNYAEAYPGKLLHIAARNGYPGSADNGTTTTIYEVYVTPRYFTF